MSVAPRGRLEKREGRDLELFSGVTPRSSKFNTEVAPGQHGARRGKLSEYGKQFREKQAAKRLYGVSERQFRNYFKKAAAMQGSTGENLLRLLERRLDNVIYRLGFARTRREASQLISHKGIEIIDGKTQNKNIVNIPSYLVKENDVVVVRERAKKQGRIQEALEISKQRNQPEWFETDASSLQGTIKRMPMRDEMPLEINELLIVELYSK